MTTTPSITTPLDYPRAMSRALRVALLAVAIVVLLTAAFVAGRTTGSSPAAGVQRPTPVYSPLNSSSVPGSGVVTCHFGAAC